MKLLEVYTINIASFQHYDVADLSSYLTSHIKHFGYYLIDLDAVPQALDEEMALTF